MKHFEENLLNFEERQLETEGEKLELANLEDRLLEEERLLELEEGELIIFDNDIVEFRTEEKNNVLELETEISFELEKDEIEEDTKLEETKEPLVKTEHKTLVQAESDLLGLDNENTVVNEVKTDSFDLCKDVKGEAGVVAPGAVTRETE